MSKKTERKIKEKERKRGRERKRQIDILREKHRERNNQREKTEGFFVFVTFACRNQDLTFLFNYPTVPRYPLFLKGRVPQIVIF